jgi:hypothetical protein
MNTSIYGNSKAAPVDRSSAGPLDLAEVTQTRPYIDFGSLRVPVRDNMQVRIEVEDQTKRVVAVTLDFNESSLQLQAFAASRHEGLWHEIRAQLHTAVLQQGGESIDGIGTLGHELNTKTPITDEAGKVVGNRLIRFVGVDGPRWFLRGVISGAAMIDPLAAGEIEDLFRGVVVVRGETPFPPKDLLPLTVPGGALLPPGSSLQ